MSASAIPAPVELPHVEIYTDGGCEPNSGPGAYGVVLLHPKTKQRKENSGGFRKTTNNRMEIFAAVAGLEMLKQPCKVTIYSDSKYVVNAMMAGCRTDPVHALNSCVARSELGIPFDD